MQALRIGMVGAGSVAARHVASLATLDGATVVGVTDEVEERRAALATAAGGEARPYDSLEAMLAGARLDAAYVCVPPYAHGPSELALVAAGLPFFVEKPLAIDLATAEEVAAAVAGAGLVSATGYHWRYFDSVERAVELVRDKPVALALASWLDKVPPPPWWRHLDRSGGPVIEQATHVLDLLRVLVGEVVSVHAAGARVERGLEGDVDDASVATLRFASGAVGSLVATSLLTWKHWAGVEVYGDGLAVRIGEDTFEVLHGPDGAESSPPRVDAKTAADRAFLAAVRSGDGAGVRAPYTEALRTHRLACAISEAGFTGRVVDLGPDGRRAG